jgi:hypothetical protein
MIEPLAQRTASLLADGRVLVAGNISTGATASAELFDPVSGSWTATAPMLEAHIEATATLLPDGTVLVAGGYTNERLLAVAELYDPTKGTWTATGSMIKARADHTATLLRDGRVLAAGGTNSSYDPMVYAELYDPASGSWTATGDMVMPAARGRTSSLLPDGRVLVVGGLITAARMLGASPELYDPASGSWTATSDMVVPSSYGHTATLLEDGRILVTGGASGIGGTSLASAELYDPASGTR